METTLEVTPERRDEILGMAAGWIVRHRLETPAIFMIEMNKPLATLGATAFHFGTPLLGPLFGERFLRDMGFVLEDRENVDRLLAEIDRRSALADADAGGS